jgi:Xaa-Pro aminopeptidase
MTKTISRIRKLAAVKREKRVDAFLITSASSVKYFSGYFFYFEYGSSPFHLLPAVLTVIPDQDACLILADNEMGQFSSVDSSIRVVDYESYTFEAPGDPARACMRKICAFIDQHHLGAARIGVEQNSLPFVIVKELEALYPSVEWVNVGPEINLCKLVKDADEIDWIRQAAALSDIGQAAVFKYAEEGMRELELFALAHRDIEASVGYRVPLMSDLSSGVGTNAGGGIPTNRVIRTGDLILSDFQACLQGYWGDSCSTMVIGTPAPEQEKNFNLVREALEIGIEAIKPGMRANKIDRLMRNHIGNYPHHSGHGVGTAYHEDPRITPYNDMELQPGMLIALEPAIYKENYGIRLEHLMLVTSGGCEVLTKFQHHFQR